jgi:iron only hydrogenase large subunit-like protein
MLSSECPGWVCYLEKVLGTKFIKYASRVKPPQLISAAILRTIFSNMSPAVNPKKIFIGLIAPCFDKKLEAAREEVRRETPVIDLVLASNEINEYLSKFIPDYDLYFRSNVKDKDFLVDCSQILLHRDLKTFGSPMPSMKEFVLGYDNFQLKRGFESKGDSNGYLSYILSCIDNIESVKYRKLKNKNFTEVKVETSEKEVLLFALVYGFKNIQNLIRKIKMKKCKYKYVEVMACPSGCINGGGQLKLKNNEVIELSKQAEESRQFYDFKEEIGKLEELILKEEKGILAKETLGFYEIEPIEDKDPLKIKW